MEVLAVDFNDGEGIARLNRNWRWEDQEQALLIACSSLIVIVEAGNIDSDVCLHVNSDVKPEAGNSRVVQFSHFSVKEFLTSSRLATATSDVSYYHIALGPAHTILAKACLVTMRLTSNKR